jgi:F0F1-type ATP synthase epsilon subunit
MKCEPFCLIVLTPGKTLLDVEGVTQIQVQLADGGGLGIYPGHVPLLAETVTAPLTYWDSEGEHSLEVEAGILRIRGTRVEIFTSGFMRARDVSPEVDSDLQFDRLAQALMARMQGQPEDMIERAINSHEAPDDGLSPSHGGSSL